MTAESLTFPVPVSLLYRISSTMWMIIVLVLFVLMGLCSVFLLLYLRPTQDNLPILSSMFAFLALLVSGMFALLNKKVDDTHHLVNSRMTELLAKTEEVSEGLGYNKALREAEIERVNLVNMAQSRADQILDHAATQAKEILATAAAAARKVKTQRPRPSRGIKR